ncbi:hypothetical protein, partial, partial [Parasitella parasitica]
LSMNTLTDEQMDGLNRLVEQFSALQESIPTQFENIAESLQQTNLKIDSLEEKTLSQVASHINQAKQQTAHQMKLIDTEIKNIQKEFTMLKADRISRSPVPQVSTPTKVRNPVTFFGKRDQCSAFFTQLALVFSVNATSFPDDKSKVIYAITNMGGIAL